MHQENDPENFANSLKDQSTEQKEKAPYFAYGASLRIFGDIPNFDEISGHLGLVATDIYKKGERNWGPNLQPNGCDMWTYKAAVEKSQPLHLHIDALWLVLKDHKEFLLKLKRDLKVDVFLTYTSDCDHAGVVVRHESLEIFRELQIPFGLSIIVA